MHNGIACGGDPLTLTTVTTVLITAVNMEVTGYNIGGLVFFPPSAGVHRPQSGELVDTKPSTGVRWLFNTRRSGYCPWASLVGAIVDSPVCGSLSLLNDLGGTYGLRLRIYYDGVLSEPWDMCVIAAVPADAGLVCPHYGLRVGAGRRGGRWMPAGVDMRQNCGGEHGQGLMDWILDFEI